LTVRFSDGKIDPSTFFVRLPPQASLISFSLPFAYYAGKA